MSKFDKHTGKGKTIEIDGDEFHLKPLGADYMGEMFKVLKCFSGIEEGKKKGGEPSMQDTLRNINDEGLEALKKMVIDTLKKSYPDEDVEKLKEFGMKHLAEMMDAIFELNAPSADKREKSKLDRIKEMKKRKENEQVSETTK